MGNQQPVNGASGSQQQPPPPSSSSSQGPPLPPQQRGANIPGGGGGPYGTPGRGGPGGGGGYLPHHPHQASPGPQGYGHAATYPGEPPNESHQHHHQHSVVVGTGGVPTSHLFQRSSSDASMTNMDPDALGGVGGSANHNNSMLLYGSGGGGSQPQLSTIELALDDESVPTVFKWEHGGRQVYITGTFNNWSRQIPMHRSGNDFTYIHNLKRGKHAFKFIVDDEWRFAPDQPTVADIEGRINNFIDVSDFKAYTGDKDFEKEKAAAEYGIPPSTGGGGGGGAGGGDDANEGETDEPQGGGAPPDKDGEVFSHTMPDLDDYTKEPPPLPPHLRHIILNKPPQLQDTAALPVPQHVALNHLYCTAIKDNMMVLGVTQRYKTKFVTTVYYSPCSGK